MWVLYLWLIKTLVLGPSRVSAGCRRKEIQNGGRFSKLSWKVCRGCAKLQGSRKPGTDLNRENYSKQMDNFLNLSCLSKCLCLRQSSFLLATELNCACVIGDKEYCDNILFHTNGGVNAYIAYSNNTFLYVYLWALSLGFRSVLSTVSRDQFSYWMGLPCKSMVILCILFTTFSHIVSLIDNRCDPEAFLHVPLQIQCAVEGPNHEGHLKIIRCPLWISERFYILGRQGFWQVMNVLLVLGIRYTGISKLGTLWRIQGEGREGPPPNHYLPNAIPLQTISSNL